MKTLAIRAIIPIWLFIATVVTVAILYRLADNEKIVTVFIIVNLLIGIGYVLCELKTVIKNDERRFITDYLERYIHD